MSCNILKAARAPLFPLLEDEDFTHLEEVRQVFFNTCEHLHETSKEFVETYLWGFTIGGEILKS